MSFLLAMMAHMLLCFISFLVSTVFVLLNVAFFTLLERKILGLSQTRKGPNKVGISGLAQPFSDAGKLFTKETFAPKMSNKVMFLLGPAVALALMMMMWVSVPSKTNFLDFKYSVILFLFILSLGVYPLFIMSWSSNSKYASLGSMRGIAQSISYEVSLALILMSLLNTMNSLKIFSLKWTSTSPGILSCTLVVMPLFALWLMSCLAESNRAPFDFSEGESELVSGFNVEYGASYFALIFIAEYGMIMVLSVLSSMIFFAGMPLFVFITAHTLVMSGWVLVRATFPRFRYDLLMSLNWKSILPTTLILFLSFVPFSS